MFALQLRRGVATFVRNHPNVDRLLALCTKGGDLRNFHITAKATGLRPLFCNTSYRNTNLQILRSFSVSKATNTDVLSKSDLKRAIDHLTDQFTETRELLEDARESVGTVYFSEDMEEASESVNNTLQEYQELLRKLTDEQRQDVLRTIGLKMEELKAQQQALEEVS